MEDLLHSGRTGQFWATHNIKFLPRKLKIYPNLVTRHQEKLGQETTAQIRWECQILFVKDFYIYHNPQPAIFFSQRQSSATGALTLWCTTFIHFPEGNLFAWLRDIHQSHLLFTGRKVSHQCCFVVNQLEKLESSFAYCVLLGPFFDCGLIN